MPVGQRAEAPTLFLTAVFPPCEVGLVKRPHSGITKRGETFYGPMGLEYSRGRDGVPEWRQPERPRTLRPADGKTTRPDSGITRKPGS